MDIRLLTVPILLLMIWAMWKVVSPMLRLGIRWWVPLVLCYTLWLVSFWVFIVLRIFFPPEQTFSAFVLAVVLVMLYFSYPMLWGVAAHILYAHESGGLPSWQSAFLKTKRRYPKILLAFSSLVLVYAVVVFGIYAMFGNGWAEYFQIREASLSKVEVLWEALIAGFAFSVFVDMLPPIIFPFGIFVGLANPSSEFFFAMVIASLLAVGILFIPMLRLIFWLPLVTLKEDVSLSASLSQVWRASLGKAVGKEIAVILRSLVLWLVLASLLLFTPMQRLGPILSIGRWVARGGVWGWTPVLLGVLPGTISLIFQHERLKLYKEFFEAL